MGGASEILIPILVRNVDCPACPDLMKSGPLVILTLPLFGSYCSVGINYLYLWDQVWYIYSRRALSPVNFPHISPRTRSACLRPVCLPECEDPLQGEIPAVCRAWPGAGARSGREAGTDLPGWEGPFCRPFETKQRRSLGVWYWSWSCWFPSK